MKPFRRVRTARLHTGLFTDAPIVTAGTARPRLLARRAVRMAAVATTVALLAACGLKAPLYMPKPVNAPPPVTQDQKPASSTSSVSQQNRPTNDTPIP
jgi:predicted small lipoprotein YifL